MSKKIEKIDPDHATAQQLLDLYHCRAGEPVPGCEVETCIFCVNHELCQKVWHLHETKPIHLDGNYEGVGE